MKHSGISWCPHVLHLSQEPNTHVLQGQKNPQCTLCTKLCSLFGLIVHRAVGLFLVERPDCTHGLFDYGLLYVRCIIKWHLSIISTLFISEYIWNITSSCRYFWWCPAFPWWCRYTLLWWSTHFRTMTDSNQFICYCLINHVISDFFIIVIGR